MPRQPRASLAKYGLFPRVARVSSVTNTKSRCRTRILRILSNRLSSCLTVRQGDRDAFDGSSRAACRRCADGRADGCLLRRVARSTRRISFRTRSSIRYGASISSSRGMRVRFRPICARPCSTAFVTRRDGSRRRPRRRRVDDSQPARTPPRRSISPLDARASPGTKRRCSVFVQPIAKRSSAVSNFSTTTRN